MSQRPLVYLILGASGSGRREIVADLIEGGLDDAGGVCSLLAEGEAADASDGRLGAVRRWTWADGRIDSPAGDAAGPVFFFADGRRNPVDQLEAFPAWLRDHGGGLARVVCVIHCGLAARHPALLPWFDACVHFADVVLLNRREGVANKWLVDYQARFAARFLPCLVEPVANGRVRNPALILEPEARRMAQLFDEPADVVPADTEVESDDDEPGSEDEAPAADPWLERRRGGRRVHELPDIREYLA